MLQDLKKAIRLKNVESFNQHLTELEKLFQDCDITVGKALAASGALHYAAEVGSIPIMNTLIQKGVGKALLWAE